MDRSVVIYFLFLCFMNLLLLNSLLVENCDHICYEGGCKFQQCASPQCPGGACLFLECSKPTCHGGACTFDSCYNASCRGGSCTFLNPPHTLKSGYCDGQNCNLHGVPHPTLEDFLTL